MTLAISADEQDPLFAAAESSLLADMGNVSIVKFLGGSDEADARDRWFQALEAFLAPMPPRLFIESGVKEGRPVLRFLGGLTLTLDLYDVQAREAAHPWRAKTMPGLAPIVIDASAEALWGDGWAAAVSDAARGESFPVTPRSDAVAGRWAGPLSERLAASGDGRDADGAYGWVVRAAPSEAPWPWFASEEHARRAAQALQLGATRVGALFEEWMRVSGG